MLRYRQLRPRAQVSLGEAFGVRSLSQVRHDLGEIARDGLTGRRFQFGFSSIGLLRPSLALPAYAGLRPRDGCAPIFNLFDRLGGGMGYSQRVTRTTCRDFRGGRLSYDEHDGTDFVCPIGTPLCAAAPGVVVMIRDRWLRGGLTVSVDHGNGVITQYTHASRVLVSLGQEVERGEPAALSGAAGIDLVHSFPWVPPHIHFMVFVHGRPTDPFLAPSETAGPGRWLDENDPQPSGPLPGETVGKTTPVDEQALERAATACIDPMIRDELTVVADRPAMLAALLEDALHHDRWAFPALDLFALRGSNHRRPTHPPRLRKPGPMTEGPRLSLPLPASIYRRAAFADSRFTAPA